MATKPSIATQLRNAKIENTAQAQEVEKLKKQLADKENLLKYASTRATDAEGEVKQIHAFLDAVPNPPADKLADGYTKVSAMTRLAVYLATPRA